jgi:hypothetical protein
MPDLANEALPIQLSTTGDFGADRLGGEVPCGERIFPDKGDGQRRNAAALAEKDGRSKSFRKRRAPLPIHASTWRQQRRRLRHRVLGGGHCDLPARESGDEMHISALVDAFELAIGDDLTVDRDRAGRSQERTQTRVTAVEFIDDLADSGSIDGKQLVTIGERCVNTLKMNRCHNYPTPFRAARTAGGDIGKLVMRTPVAAEMAFATAASGGTIGVSPTPRTP